MTSWDRFGGVLCRTWRFLFSFPPQRHFLLLGPVWFAILLILVMASAVYLCILFEDGLWGKWDWSSRGVNHWADSFKVPIGLLAMTVPVVAIMATHHRSVQAAHQMHLSNQQNITTNYYAHLKEFKEYIKRHPWKEVEIGSSSGLYRWLFPESLAGELAISEFQVKQNLSLLSRVCKVVESLIDEAEGSARVWDARVGELLELANEFYIIRDRSKLSIDIVGFDFMPVKYPPIMALEFSENRGLIDTLVECYVFYAFYNFLFEFDPFASEHEIEHKVREYRNVLEKFGIVFDVNVDTLPE